MFETARIVCFSKHHDARDCKKCWCEDITLLYTILNGERVGELPVVLHLTLLACVELLRDVIMSNLEGHPVLFKIRKSMPLLMMPNAFVTSIKVA